MSGELVDLDDQLPARRLDADEVEALVQVVQQGLRDARAHGARRRAAVRVALAAMALLVAGMAVGSWWTPSTLERVPTPVAVVPAPDEGTEDTGVDDRVLASAGSRYTLHGPPQDRVVALEVGRVRCEVADREDTGRFRVVVGADEVEVTGTVFEVVAVDETLTEVRVTEGSVVVRLADGQVHRLAAGETWTRPVEVIEAPASPPRAVPAAAADEASPDAPPPATSPAAQAFAAGLAAWDAANHAEAYARFSAVTEGPMVADARFWAGMSRVKLGRDAGAVAVLQAARHAGVPPERAATLDCVLSDVLEELGRSDEAPGCPLR